MKRVYDELSEDGPITQEDVKYFKKQAIWRQMKFYKQKYQVSEKLLKYKENGEKSDNAGNDDDIDKLKFENDKLIKEIEELNILLKQQDRETSDSVKRINQAQVKEEVKTEVIESKPDDNKVKALEEVIKSYEEKLKSNEVKIEEKVVDVVKVEIIKDFNMKTPEDLDKYLDNKRVNFEELINNKLKSENDELKQLLSKNEKDLVRIRNIRDDLIGKINQYESAKTNEELIKLNEELNSKLDFQNNLKDKENEDIIKELEESYKNLISSINVKIMNKLDQDNLVKKYQIEKSKADQKYFQIMKTKDTLTNENKLLKLNLNKLNDIISEKLNIETSLNAKINKLQDIIKDFEKVIANLNIKNNQLIEKEQFKGKEMNKLVSKIDSLVEEINNLKRKEGDFKKQLNLKDLEFIKFKHGLTSSSPVDNNEELNGFRSMVKCSVCSKNWKNMAITVCGHVFCNECVKERLNARLRRCPSCNKGFSANDLLSIHL